METAKTNIVFSTLLCYNKCTILDEVVILNSGSLPDVRPVSDLRQNMAEIMESIDTEKRPVILTKHGRGKYVLLRIEDYNCSIAMQDLYKAIDDGIDDIEAGRISDFQEFAKQLRKELIDGRV